MAYLSWIRIRICICPYGSGSGSDFYYTNPDPQIRISITDLSTDSSAAVLQWGDGCYTHFSFLMPIFVHRWQCYCPTIRWTAVIIYILYISYLMPIFVDRWQCCCPTMRRTAGLWPTWWKPPKSRRIFSSRLVLHFLIVLS